MFTCCWLLRVAAVSSATLEGYWQLIGVGFLLGIAGASFAVGVPFVAGWYPRTAGSPSASTGWATSARRSPFFGAPASSTTGVGPRSAGSPAAMLLGGASVGSRARNAPVAGAAAHYGEVLRAGSRLYRLAFFYFITFGGFVAMALLLPKLLKDWFGYSKGEAGAAAAGFSSPRRSPALSAAGSPTASARTPCSCSPSPESQSTRPCSRRSRPRRGSSRSRSPACPSGSSSARATAPSSSSSPGVPATTPGRRPAIVGAAGGLGGFFPPIVVGLIKDARRDVHARVRRPARGRPVCLTLAVWLSGPRRPPSCAERASTAMAPSVSSPRFFTPRASSGRAGGASSLATAARGRRLPRPLAARPGRALHPRRQLHRLVLVEDLRQGRDRHLGDPADRLPLERPGHARVRAARLPARRVVLLVRLLADAGQVPVRARRPARAVPRGAASGPATRSTPGRRSSRTRRRRGATSRSAGRAGSCARPGTRSRSSSPPRTSTRSKPLRARPRRRLLADPGDVDGLVRGRHALPLADRRRLPQLLRLVRRPAARLAADLGRPDRRARVGRLVERELPDALGLEHPADPHAGRAFHDRGALPRPEGRRRLPGLRRPHEVRRPLAPRRRPGPTAPSRWRWAT